MKTKIISTLKKELLIIEIPERVEPYTKGQTVRLKIDGKFNNWEVLGSPDEVKEIDLVDLVHQSIHSDLFAHYVEDVPVNTYCYKNALESFNSALESENLWENHVSLERADHYRKVGNEFSYNGIMKCWSEAQENTFDRKRTLIFVKN